MEAVCLRYAVMTDFGSTYTKVVCADLEDHKTVLTDKFPSTVHTDAMIGLHQCYDAVAKVIGQDELDAAFKLSTSSAAGGLRMAVSGLTKSLSNAAGKNACCSAGGKLVYAASGMLKPEDIQAMDDNNAEIILLCGGYEHGNFASVLENAKTLSDSQIRTPVIYAGNSEVAQEIRMLFKSHGKECFLADNIIPAVGELNIGPTTDIIRDLFMSRITNMKGVGGVQRHLNGPITPTPAAVLRAGELLSEGTDTSEGLGSFMMVDVGGATTDVYSFCENKPYQGARQIGAEEPTAKRTVEGDMGMRESSMCLMAEVGEEAFAKGCQITVEEAREAVNMRNIDRAYLADNPKDLRIDDYIARNAIGISARRHAGYIEKGYMQGLRLIQRGKNLKAVTRVIGTGGILVNSEDALSKLRCVQASQNEKDEVLLPTKVDTCIENDYVLFAAGLLADHYPETAIRIIKHSIGIED